MAKKVEEYYVVQSDNMVEFRERVNTLIKDGWECQGGIACDPYRHYQAMVKYKD